MLTVNDVSAWVEVDGMELEQHGVEAGPNHNQATCWIATQAGKNFSVVFRDNAPYREHSLASSIQLDGSSVRGKVFHASRIGPMFPDSMAVRTVSQGYQLLSATTSQPFMFSKLELTDEDEYLNQASGHLGEIEISIHRVQAIATHMFECGSKALGHTKVHERSKKAVTHCVSFGQEMVMPTQYGCSVRRVDGDIPLATFIFRYRDLGLLQANGIIPKPIPAVKKAFVSEGVLDLTIGDGVKPEPIDDEVEIVEHAARKQKRTAVPMKRSNSSHEMEIKPVKKIKREKTFVPSGEVIDLT